MRVPMPEVAIVLVMLAGVALVIWPATRICAKAGFTPWLGVLSVVPLVNVALLWFVAFSPWPGRR